MATAAAGCTLKIATYNILLEKHAEKNSQPRKELSERTQNLIRKIFSLQADIICLQECSFQFFKQLQEKLTDFQGIFNNHIIYKGPNRFQKIEEGTALLYKKCFVTGSTGVYYIQAPQTIKWHACSHVTFKDEATQEKLRVVSLHVPGNKKVEEFGKNLLNRDIFGDSDFARTLVLAGDFNHTNPQNWLNKPGWILKKDPSTQPTEFLRGPRKIDHILCYQQQDSNSNEDIKIIPSGPNDPPNPPATAPKKGQLIVDSDHYPAAVTCTFGYLNNLTSEHKHHHHHPKRVTSTNFFKSIAKCIKDIFLSILRLLGCYKK